MSRRWGGAAPPCIRSCLCGALAPAIHGARLTERAAQPVWVSGCRVMGRVAKGSAHAPLGAQTGMAIVVMTVKSRRPLPSLGSRFWPGDGSVCGLSTASGSERPLPQSCELSHAAICLTVRYFSPLCFRVHERHDSFLIYRLWLI